MSRRKKALKWIAGGFGTLGIALGVGVGWLLLARPLVAAPSSESVERTPERLARGEYLANHVAMCMHCHSEHDDTRLGMPVVPGTLGHGGLTLDPSYGLPGTITPPNITPDRATGIGDWSDGEIIRAIREGIGRDGRALFPMMPYLEYRHMSDEDVRAIVVYLRSLEAIEHAVAPPELDFPVNLLIRLAPEPIEGEVEPPGDDPVARGEYLVRLSLCEGCHTPMDERGQGIEGMEFAGGREFLFPTPEPPTRTITPNISPDPNTGYFGRTTKAGWIERVRSTGALANDPPAVEPAARSLMPWFELAGLSDEDLGAIWAYMQTVEPIENRVTVFPDASP